MKANLENKLLAVIRVRGRVGVRHDIEETLKRLNLKRVNNLSLVYGTKSNIGMVRKCNDFITYGEISSEILQKLVDEKRSTLEKSALEEIASGKKSASELTKMPIQMHPPRRGYESTKKGVGDKGALGYRGESINNLIKRMM